MNKTIPIAGLALLVILGLSMGRRLSPPSETTPVANPERTVVPSRPLADALDELKGNVDQASLYDLERDLESRTFAELEQEYLQRIQEDPHGLDCRRMLNVMLTMDAGATLALVSAILDQSTRDHEHARLLQEWGKFAPNEALLHVAAFDQEAFSLHLIPTSINNFLGEWAPRSASSGRSLLHRTLRRGAHTDRNRTIETR
jgi:hypothetical protein